MSWKKYDFDHNIIRTPVYAACINYVGINGGWMDHNMDLKLKNLTEFCTDKTRTVVVGVVGAHWWSAQVTCLGWKSEFSVTRSFSTFWSGRRKNDQQPNTSSVCTVTKMTAIANPVGQVMHHSLFRIATERAVLFFVWTHVEKYDKTIP